MTEVMTFYRFTSLTNLPELQEYVTSLADGLKGTVLLAAEGINATLAGERARLEAFARELERIDGLEGLRIRYSSASPGNPVFHRLKVRIRNEIVTLGQPAVDPARRTGIHVDAATWNALLEDPEVLVIDTRNHYEVAIGSFPGAQDPCTDSFRQFPDYVAGLDRQRRVAMFCTGGIRCEKASALMLEQGFETVYQLDGGILSYLETVDPAENRWQGECFVFDQRVSVDDSLGEGAYEQCFACRRPLTPADLASPDYSQGVSCPYCAASQSAGQRDAFMERQRQVELARERGDVHVGKAMPRT
jgi:UPF0176 protein